MLRPFGMVVMLPMLSGRALGSSLARNCLVLLLAIPVVPLQMISADTLLILSAPAVVLLGLKEIAVGVLIGFCIAIPFWAIETAGTIIDTIRGTSMASALNPLLGEQSSVFGILFSQILVVTFFVGGGFNTTLEAIYNSYQTLPTTASFVPSGDFPAFIKQQWRAMADLSVSFAMPAIVVMVLVDLALGFVNRSAQQLNVFFIAMPIKSAVALFMLAISMAYGLSLFTGHFTSIGDTTRALIQALVPAN
ncbi:hypothetical protein LMG32289_06168 [Cupriavidus pampae]|uniref:EscT/YscT/HrcT family type III secretion system export apparatus protein n=2 Tax=Cupriavidus pampae TaxID=659251 RepID=A0ABN7ZL42_9BURK|nr:hypothetical protein LMG32289_06168 [Cupriavidus pampae]